MTAPRSRPSTSPRPYFAGARRNIRLQIGVLRVLRDELEQVRSEPGPTSLVLRQMDEELDRLESLVDDAIAANA